MGTRAANVSLSRAGKLEVIDKRICAHLHLNPACLVYEWTAFLNESSESMIQLHIHKDSQLLRSWMNQLFKRINYMNDSVIKSVTCRHLLAVLVQFLKDIFVI